MEITNNEIIAQFMGFKFLFERGHRVYSVPVGKDKEYQAFKLAHVKFLYDTSWVWLMTVINKIDFLGFDTHISHIVGMQNGEPKVLHICSIQKLADTVVYKEGSTKFESVYNAVLAFIEWHAKTKS